MLELRGSARRKFAFPGSAAAAADYYGNLRQIIPFLKYISIAASSAKRDNVFRLAYRTKEMGVYDVCVYCDVIYERDGGAGWLELKTLEPSPFPLVSPVMGSNGTTTTGTFLLRSRLEEVSSERTIITLTADLKSVLPEISGVRFVPQRLIKNLVERTAGDRLDEIMDNFIRESVIAYQNQ